MSVSVVNRKGSRHLPAPLLKRKLYPAWNYLRRIIFFVMTSFGVTSL